MGDTSSQPPYGCEPVAHANFALQPAKFSAILKSVNVPYRSGTWHCQSCHRNTKSFLAARGCKAAYFSLGRQALQMRKPVEEELRNISAVDSGSSPFQQLLPRSIHQGNAAFNIGGNQAAADGMHHVFVKGLQAEEFTAFILKLQAGLAQLGSQRAGKMRHGKIGEEVNEDDDQQRLGIAAWRRLK